ncbi:UNVERIFIED_CONTAM: hypothetical protein GTU68_061550, partial [Idotea baltica]|nr:hypothetical protein [Idotea baltica]
GKYVFEKKLTDKRVITLDTLGGIKEITLEIENNITKSITVDMEEPILGEKIVNHKLDGFPYEITCVSIGNPHAVIFVDEITDKMVLEDGPKIEVHPFFPEKANIEFVKIINRNEVEMRVWERGSGETLACGTGACAVAVAAHLNDLTDRNVKVKLLGGDLEINWNKENRILMTGGAEFVFEGSIVID